MLGPSGCKPRATGPPNSPSGAILQRDVGASKAWPSRHSRALLAAASAARGRGSGGAVRDCPSPLRAVASCVCGRCDSKAIAPQPAPAVRRPGGNHDRCATTSSRIAVKAMHAVAMLVGLRYPALTGERPAAAHAAAIPLQSARPAQSGPGRSRSNARRLGLAWLPRSGRYPPAQAPPAHRHSEFVRTARFAGADADPPGITLIVLI